MQKRSIIIRAEYERYSLKRRSATTSIRKLAPIQRFIAETFNFLNAVPISSTVC